MGEMAEDIIDGFCCELCCCYFEKQHGYPVVCKECWDDLTPEEKRIHQQAVYDLIG
jgi:hypothetical protein